MNPADTTRLFFALSPDEATRLKLARLNLALAAKGYRPVPPQNLHVTLVFLGQVDAATACLIKHGVKDISARPFTLTFDRLSYWPKPKVLCLTGTQIPDELSMLVTALTNEAVACGLKIDTRPYQAHITLVRPAQNLPDMDIEPLLWRADAFYLMESCSTPDGVCYQLRQQWPFIKSTV